ncbi:TonB-dependent receptor [Sphingopyxis sp. USTB-05]|uniref:TonB-dependent receptor n=1 Tax=Sphingopyxis sp. USTB-05 TaxID=2830667 RepID=UPI002078F6D9|nr:TonB-dependent receptor [Sphingopyxis sp. USTB-05]USI77611.1 TonB-dependent receptor [Sphingopyxis sp. USTB-05]
MGMHLDYGASNAMRRRLMASVSIAILTLALGTPAAHAQDAPTEAAAQADDQSAMADPNDIIVTATRKAEALSKIPVSVAAFSQEQLDVQGVSTVDSLVKNTPGVTLRRDGDGTSNIAVRGISSTIGAATTGVYIDDTPVQIRQAGLSFTATNAFPNILDLERVEVLRGPQGTLFGSGSMGGAIRFITPQPSLDELQVYGRADVSFTHYGEANFETVAAVGAPIIEDKLGFRISASYTREGGWIDRIPRPELQQQYLSEQAGLNRRAGSDKNANWGDAYTFRLAVTAKPAENIRITPSVYFQQTYQNSASDFWEFFSDPKKGVFRNGDVVDGPKRDRWWLPALATEFDFDFATLATNTSYFIRSNPNTYDVTTAVVQLTAGGEQVLTPMSEWVPGAPYFASAAYDPNRQKVFTQELRLQSNNPDSRFGWLLGLFYQHSKGVSEDFVLGDETTFNQLTNGLFGVPNYVDFFGVPLIDGQIAYQTYDKLIDKQYAAFGELNYKILDNLTVTVGARFSKNKLVATSLQGGPYAGTSTLSGFTASQSESPITPKFNISWQATPDSLLYATASKGFRGGGVNQPLPDRCDAGLADAGFSEPPDSYDSDSLWSYEVGTKNRLFNNRLSLDASAFHIDWTGIQNAVYIGLGCNRSVVFNAANAKIDGFDIAATVRPVDNLTVAAAAGYVNAKYSDDLLGGADANGVQPLIIAKGDSIPNVTPWSVSASVQYDTVLAGKDVYLRGEYQYAGRKRPSTINNPLAASYNANAIPDAASNEFNLRLGVALGDVDLTAYVDNVFDATPRYRTSSGDAGNTVFRGFTLRPRTVGVTVSYRR